MEEFDNGIITKFLEVETIRELAAILDTPYKTLKYNLYKVQDEDKYEVFEIKKEVEAYVKFVLQYRELSVFKRIYLLY